MFFNEVVGKKNKHKNRKAIWFEYIITGEPQHTERYDYPLDAIREIVINMLVHRDYRSSNGSIIKIYDNKIEFYNPGGLFGDLTLEELLRFNYSSQTRNKLIAQAFKEIGIIEKYGSGIKRIFTICKNYGIIPPEIIIKPNGFKVILYKEKIKVGDKVGDRVGDKVGDRLTENQKKIVMWMQNNSTISAHLLSEKVGISKRKIETNIKKLKELGYIKRIGSAKGGYWEIIK
jgi:ATP-dependent DNA helicase RecG